MVCGLPRGFAARQTTHHPLRSPPLAGGEARGGGPYTIFIPLRLCVKTILTPKLKYTQRMWRFYKNRTPCYN